MTYTIAQIEGFAREAEVLASDKAFSSGSPDWVISRNSHAAAMLRQLLKENDALRDGLDSYIGFVNDAHILEGNHDWLPDGDSAQEIVEAAIRAQPCD